MANSQVMQTLTGMQLSKQKITISMPSYKSNRLTRTDLIRANAPVFTGCKWSSAQIRISFQQGKSNLNQSINLACIFV